MNEVIENIIKSDENKYQKLSDILKYLFVDICGIPRNKYFILGSFAIRKYRIISDLDINLDYKEFLKLSKLTNRNMGKIEFYNNQIRWFFDMTKEYNELINSQENDFSIETFQKLPEEGFPNSEFSLDYLTKHNGLDRDENGHQYFSLETLLKWKKKL